MTEISEQSFETIPIENWSLLNTEEWLKSCLNKYQMDDPKIYTKIKIKGKGLKILHEFRELNKHFSEEHANILHQDLDLKLGRKISTRRKPTLQLVDKFEKQLDEINVDFGKMLDRIPDRPYANELIIEALYSLGKGNIFPIECLVSRMVNTLYKQYTVSSTSSTALHHLENGHVRLCLPIDDAVGAFVQKFYLHGYPSLAELMLENILYLGQLGAVSSNYGVEQCPAVVIVPSQQKNKQSIDSGYDSTKTTPRTSTELTQNNHYLNTLETVFEYSDSDEIEPDQSLYSPVWETFQEASWHHNSVFIEGNNIIVDYATDEIADDRKLTFNYDSDLVIKFDVTCGKDSKIITNKDKSFTVKIENNTKNDVGFSLRVYNLSLPGDIKVLYPQTGSTFRILQREDDDKRDHIWQHDIELIQSLIDQSGDYVIFELVVCSLKNELLDSIKGNTWNIQRNFIQVQCSNYNNSTTDPETIKELYSLSNTMMGNGKRKKSLKIILESLYYYMYNNEEKAYWLATQLLLLPDFQRPQFLVFIWAQIGTYIYQGKDLDFSQHRRLIALINAVNSIKKKIERLNTKILTSIVESTDKTVNILQQYLERQRMRKSQSYPDDLSESSSPLPIISIKPATPETHDNSPPPSRHQSFTIHPSISEPNLHNLCVGKNERSKAKPKLLQYKKLRKASRSKDNITFGNCVVTCPPSPTEFEIDFSYAIMDTTTSQTTIIPGVRHLATLVLENNLDKERYIEPFEIKFPIPRKVSKLMTMRVAYQDGQNNEEILDTIQTNFKADSWSILAPRNGTYLIIGLDPLPEKLTRYVANDIFCVRPLYVQIWYKQVGAYGKWCEIWCCISCKKNLLIRPPHVEAWPLSKAVINTRSNDKIEFSLLPTNGYISAANELDMKYEFLLTETQGIFNFVHILNLEIVGSEIMFRINSQEDAIEKEIQIGTFL
ncbi:hypothetical protein LOD99_13454 [Oopsacas minuta]|uniref:Uncharacterized protein n=1 Tax=Oopsacas minuta TaxID=111878 RepID=A0AAV7KJH1_9METZ|nr:hypothetical protein LOD99_13454 [Oopsacas minuta]